ncbi:unnamed protein product [Callosobruchus maculatus]|uniref:BESS domain-containing protein n=1 Tax=Callosobruchus maculatus TaxID=64391 RepID=A0A653D0J1_CALMS|nr:unnamed protein product [Callosobruchus maculatus]
MSWIYNNESDQVIIDEESDEVDITANHVDDENASVDTAGEMVLPVISSVYSENPEDQNCITDFVDPGSVDAPTAVPQQDNDSSISDSDIELVSVDYTNDTLSDSSEDKKIQTIPKKKKKKHGQMLPNPCEIKSCRNGCSSITEAERKVVYEEFRRLNSEAKKAYVQQWVNVSIPEHLVMGGKVTAMKTTRNYYILTQNNIPIKVCAQFFRATLGISLSLLNRYLKEKINDATKSIEAGQPSIINSMTNNVVSNQIDIPEMIREIQRREEIWNLLGQQQLDVDAAWDDICNALVENYSSQTLAQQNYIRKELIAKWCDLKSSYFNYFVKKRQLHPSNPNGGIPFMPYSHLLTFLDSTFSSDATIEGCSSQKPDGYATVFIMEDHQSVDLASSETTNAEPLKNKTSPFDEGHLTKKPKLGEQSNPYGVLLSVPFTVDDQPSLEAPEAEKEWSAAPLKPNATGTNAVSSGAVDSEECELNFFKSLLPIIKTLDQQKRLQFRLGVITNLQKLTAGESRQDDTVSAPSSSQLNGNSQSEISQAAPQNPVITSTSLSAGRLSTDNLNGNVYASRTKSPDFSVLLSSGTDDDSS